MNLIVLKSTKISQRLVFFVLVAIARKEVRLELLTLLSEVFHVSFDREKKSVY